jgi:hypothetical protein
MTLNDHIANFLRDAQYKIAEISVKMNEIEDQGSYQYRELHKSRRDLTRFMNSLYEGKWLIQSGYNHMQIGEPGEGKTWTEREVIEEIQHLRYYNKMNEVPYITFTARYPKIVSIINGGGPGSGNVGNLPSGVFGQLMGFNGAGQPEPQTISPWGGHIDGESITAYFSGRL